MVRSALGGGCTMQGGGQTVWRAWCGEGVSRHDEISDGRWLEWQEQEGEALLGGTSVAISISTRVGRREVAKGGEELKVIGGNVKEGCRG